MLILNNDTPDTLSLFHAMNHNVIANISLFYNLSYDYIEGFVPLHQPLSIWKVQGHFWVNIWVVREYLVQILLKINLFIYFAKI